MNTYIAFLRGINVSGQKKIKMADLKQSLLKVGLKNVQTYIQSGNIVFDTAVEDIEEIGGLIEKVIHDDFEFDVPVTIKTSQEIREILNTNPFYGNADPKGLYFALLLTPPSQDLAASFQQLEFEHEDFQYTDACVYLHCKKGAGRAKLNNNLIENKLKVTATTRNLNTMRKMVELAAINSTPKS